MPPSGEGRALAHQRPRPAPRQKHDAWAMSRSVVTARQRSAVERCCWSSRARVSWVPPETLPSPCEAQASSFEQSRDGPSAEPLRHADSAAASESALGQGITARKH